MAALRWVEGRDDRIDARFANGDIQAGAGLMSYLASVVDNFRRAAEYADKIFNGARLGDLPIEQPTRFEFALNLSTARAIGVAIPSAVRLRADRLVE